MGCSVKKGMLFYLISADPTLSKQRGKKRVSEWVFSLSIPTLFTRSLNFRPGGRGPSVPILLRGGGAGNLSQRIKGPSAEEVQACSYPCLPDEQGRPPPASRPASCLRELPGGKYPPAALRESSIPPCGGQEICRVRVARARWFW